MKKVTLQIDDLLYDFYRKLGVTVFRTPEKVMEDALFRMAGEASLEAIDHMKKRGR